MPCQKRMQKRISRFNRFREGLNRLLSFPVRHCRKTLANGHGNLCESLFLGLGSALDLRHLCELLPSPLFVALPQEQPRQVVASGGVRRIQLQRSTQFLDGAIQVTCSVKRHSEP